MVTKRHAAITHPKNARTPEQRRVMQKIWKDGVCPFCPKHFLRYHPKPVLFETKHWTVTENAWPYKNTKHHFLLVSKKHVTELSKLAPAAWSDLNKSLTTLAKKWKLNRGSLLIRFGNLEHTGASVDHLHAHLIVAASKRKTVKARVG